MDTSKQLGEEKISKLLLKFSIPAIVGMLVNALYNVVDRIFIGNSVGPLGIAGITIGFPIMLVIMAFAMLIGIGANSLISIRLGEQRKEEAELILGNAVVMLVITSMTISGTGLIFIEPLLRIFGASAAVLPYAKEYLSIILLGTVIQTVGFGMNNFIRAEGNPRIAMFTMIIGAILNTILDPIFIYVFGLGIRGAAIATVLSQAVSASWVLYHFFGGRSTLKVHTKNLRLHTPIVVKIVSLGAATFFMQMAASVLNAIMNKSLVIYGGDIAVSGMGVIMSIAMLILMPIFGINQGAQPIIGYNYGALEFDRVKKALKLAVAAATIITTIGFILTRVFPSQLILLFNRTDKDLLNFGTRAISIYLIFLPIIGFQIVSANYFQAVGKPKHAAFLSLSRQVLILIPALLILPLFFGLEGLLMAGPASDLISSVITGIFLIRELKNLDARHRGAVVQEQN
ncbi:MAG TPA: MATE family efflux transporter [Bacillota bacterium]|nr:MATE family efflux transporter [Bacillota bacterium]HPA55211.1 MATE family efflux transporter [Bacillota bacterium]HPX68979.1 MATE family efflux transporter [Bacillota bacterium]HQA64537.1 MATE family efflux transporter [Bacillota bacterium]HQO43762.1 MATE family efflux transporter [Bacillota bacterium]